MSDTNLPNVFLLTVATTHRTECHEAYVWLFVEETEPEFRRGRLAH